MSWLRRNWVAALGVVLLVGVVGIEVASLTSSPTFNGNEPWYLSANKALFDGDGYKPIILAGSGAYDGMPDYWGARVGAIPSLLGEAILPTTLAAVRIPILLTGLTALFVFWLAMRRTLDSGVALIATAALGSTWGFHALTHWVRFDAVAILAMCAILALLVPGPPSFRAAVMAGVVLGIGPDFANSVPAAFPGALVLCAWERERRWVRVGGLIGGVFAGLVLFALLHFAAHPNLGQAREQFDVVFRPNGYGEIPLLEAIKSFSLDPILNEKSRYTDMLYVEWQSVLIVLSIGVLASGLLILRALGVASRWLAIAGAAGLALMVAVPLIGGTPHTELRDAIWVMIIATAGLALVLSIAALRTDRPYPTKAAPGILLIGALVGFALYVSLRTQQYSPYVFPFAVAAFACALDSLSPVRLRAVVPAIVLAIATIASSVHLVSEIRAEPSEAALDEELSERAREIVPPGQTVMGEWVYWWLYKDDRFRTTSALWLQEWQHQDETFEEAFHRVCPDYVLLDDVWLARYDAIQLTEKYPENVFPTDPGEREELQALLRREYGVADQLEVEGRTITFWRRAAPDCPAVS